MQTQTENNTSATAFGARYGVWGGLYLSVISAALIFSVKAAALSVLITPMLLVTPVLLWFYMEMVWKKAQRLHTLSALWFSGITLFIFSSLICGLVSCALIYTFEPNFVAEYVRAALSQTESLDLGPQFSEQAATLRTAADSGMLPSPFGFVMSMMWSTSFFGSLLSLAVASAVKIRHDLKAAAAASRNIKS